MALTLTAAVLPGRLYAMDEDHRVDLSAAGKASIQEILRDVRRGRWTDARAVVTRTKDPLAVDVYEWFYYTREAGPVEFRRISAFIRHHPGWPRLGKMRLAAEKAMPKSLPDAEVVTWYKQYPPLTPDGMDRYVQALVDTGKGGEAIHILRDWWRKTTLTPPQQAGFIAKYGRMIDRNTHIARFGYLMMKQNYSSGRVIARMLGNGYPDLAEARIALAEGAAGVDTIVARVPAHLQNDAGLMFERLRWRRRNDKDVGAIEILHNMPPMALIPNPEDWWNERNIIARRLIEEHQYKSAYLLVIKHGLGEGSAYADAEFLAGWLALRHLNQPWDAFEHFESLYKKTSTPVSKARGAYWAARASDALGHPEIALQWYQVAARHQTTFYGQLAISVLDAAYRPPQITPPERTMEGKESFDRIDMVRVVRLIDEAGFWDETSDFLNALAEDVKTPEDYRLVAELAEDLGHPNNAVRIAKKGLQKGILLMDQAYPTMVRNMQNASAEWALVHALIRQESAFDYKAVSPVGALGLMQLMPATAKEVARKAGIPFRADQLTANPDYNIRLGSRYLQKMVDRFDGSYPLALAAYNGGPGRVAQWIAEFGDPRKGQIDMIDWIESIPVAETRNYVQRVLEGTYVYRLKLRGVQKSYNSPIHVAMRENQQL